MHILYILIEIPVEIPLEINPQVLCGASGSTPLGPQGTYRTEPQDARGIPEGHPL